jgi:hypothetical protein
MSVLLGVVFALVVLGVLYKIFFTKETWNGAGNQNGGVSGGGDNSDDKNKI